LAVDMHWGGTDSTDKRDWLINVVFEYFGKHGSEADVDDLETILEQVMSDEFNTLLEDNSAGQVSQKLIDVYNECMQENYTTVEALRSRHSSAPSASKKVVSGGDEEDDEDESDEEYGSEDNESVEEIDEMDVVPSSKKGPIIDDEGFQLVTKRRR
ncbi:1960_t:CDS:2, partial [Acaulospora morrowiae]